MVDEQNGSHLYFNFNQSWGALQNGADVSICNISKSLGSLGATNIINVSPSSRIAHSKVRDAYSVINSTSHSSLLLSEMDGLIRLFTEQGQEILDKSAALAKLLTT